MATDTRIEALAGGMEFVEKAVNDPARLAVVTRIIKSAGWPSQQVQTVLTALADDLECQFSAATLIDGSHQHFLATNNGPLEACSRDASHCQYVIATGSFLAINSADASPLWRRLARLGIGGKPLQAYLGAPLRVEKQVLGAVCVVDTEPREWTSEDQYAVYAASRKVAGILEEHAA